MKLGERQVITTDHLAERVDECAGTNYPVTPGPAIDRMTAEGRAIFVRCLAAAVLASVLEDIEAEQAAAAGGQRAATR